MTTMCQHIIDNADEYARCDYEDGLNGVIVFTQENLVEFVFAMIEEYDLRRSEDNERGTDT